MNDEDAWKFRKRAYILARSWKKKHADCEDYAQTVILKFLEREKEWEEEKLKDPNAPLKGQTVDEACIDIDRKHSKYKKRFNLTPEFKWLENTKITHSTMAELMDSRSILNTLDIEDKIALQMRAYGYWLSEIGRVLGCTTSAVSLRLNGIRKRLRG